MPNTSRNEIGFVFANNLLVTRAIIRRTAGRVCEPAQQVGGNMNGRAQGLQQRGRECMGAGMQYLTIWIVFGHRCANYTALVL